MWAPTGWRVALVFGWRASTLLIALALVSAIAFVPRWVRKLRTEPMPSVETIKRQLDRREDVLV